MKIKLSSLFALAGPARALTCTACHGVEGNSSSPMWPNIAGQHAAYTAKQFADYANSARTSDGKTRIMQDIAANLDKDDIAALSSYAQGLK